MRRMGTSAVTSGHNISIYDTFSITDQVNQENVTIEYCPTDQISADFMSKPLQGARFEAFKRIMYLK